MMDSLTSETIHKIISIFGRLVQNSPVAPISASGLLFLLLSALSCAQAAPCPSRDANDPVRDNCESLFVYRVQAWPGLRYDAENRDMLSLDEANASNDASFLPIIKGYEPTAQALPIRYSVERIDGPPQDYCNCNFEYNGKACKPPMKDVDLLLCRKVCLYSGKTCRSAGKDLKTDVSNGAWYAFPVATKWRGPHNNQEWKRNTFFKDLTTADWDVTRSVIIRAKCIRDGIHQDPNATVDSFFDGRCPVVDLQTIDQETKPRS